MFLAFLILLSIGYIIGLILLIVYKVDTLYLVIYAVLGSPMIFVTGNMINSD